MKKVLFLVIIMISIFGTTNALAQTKTDSFKVYGNCNMCKKRIEKAAAVEGVVKANWNVETKIMTVSYDSSRLTTDAIQKKIAAAGHDTEKEKAADQTYNKLPGCCRYDRSGGESSSHHQHHK
ncbi:heavy-metal-associated domain-containing protein [Niastella caeni]|uniref:Heavy-metal-associated domain-containing protein n=1 Tax=Niastella caeni TaxID=2569763 RepID=A0A4S8HRW0_9BACT|nr:heavy-metal-associated domain-containing protein [Niastella caeni]THU38025.1 heavy-metal-associated domain-containing protein [Niastella caeni]